MAADRPRAPRHPTAAPDGALTPSEERAYVVYARRMAITGPRRQALVATRLGAALLVWMQQSGTLHKDAAAALGVDPKVLWQYVARGAVPRSDVLERLHLVTGLSRDTVLHLAALAVAARQQRRTPGSAHAPSVEPPPGVVPVSRDPWDAFTARLHALLPAGAERRAVLAEIEALRLGALAPAQRVVAASSEDGEGSVAVVGVHPAGGRGARYPARSVVE